MWLVVDYCSILHCNLNVTMSYKPSTRSIYHTRQVTPSQNFDLDFRIRQLLYRDSLRVIHRQQRMLGRRHRPTTLQYFCAFGAQVVLGLEAAA